MKRKVTPTLILLAIGTILALIIVTNAHGGKRCCPKTRDSIKPAVNTCAKKQAESAPCCAWCPLAQKDPNSACKAICKSASNKMKMRCQIMTNTKIEKEAPQSLLAIQTELELTDEQVTKLKDIAKKARDDAKALLTETQKQKLQQIPDTPQNIKQLHQQCRTKICNKSQSKGLKPACILKDKKLKP